MRSRLACFWLVGAVAIISNALGGCGEDTQTIAPVPVSNGASRSDAGTGELESPIQEVESQRRDPGPMPLTTCGGLVGRSTCDPLSGWPCDVPAGETCEFSRSVGAFICRPGTAAFCEFCDRQTVFCGVGGSCGNDGWCVRYCCADSDCSVGPCQFNAVGEPMVAAIGYCYEEGRDVCRGVAPSGVDGGTDAAAVP
jgi:hypothetical protein